jgi:hypothetical protein
MDPSLLLDSTLKQRLEILTHCYPAPEESNDSMLHFANVMAQSTVIYTLTGMVSVLRSYEASALWSDYQPRVLAAVDQMIKLATMLTESFVFKVSH